MKYKTLIAALLIAAPLHASTFGGNQVGASQSQAKDSGGSAVTDSSGNFSDATATVMVPHNN